MTTTTSFAPRYAPLVATLVSQKLLPALLARAVLVAERYFCHRSTKRPADEAERVHIFFAHFRTVSLCQGAELFEKVHTAKILLIGAGGIGCELIKNLVLSGFVDIEIIDLDTIDVSNLNRQFLFRPRHVGMPKSIVAREMAMLFNPEAKIVAYHANIKEPRFGVKYFEQFTVVMNALDNVDARRHVNRLCLATNKVLVEAGTTGFDGQTFVIAKGQTACYECQPKPTQKVYPICTIRSTPDKPVHCVVWAKELFKLLVGVAAESLLDEPLDGPDESVYMAQVLAHPAAKGASATVEGVATYCEAVFTALFSTEVAKQLSMDKYKTAKFVPVPVPAATISAAVAAALPAASAAEPPPSPPPPPSSSGAGWDRRVWTSTECIAELCACLFEYWGSGEKSAQVGAYTFDKDDRLAMRFVAAAANLRGSVFSIESLNFHDVKGVAGNIVPAIATTNAIVAGQQVLELFKILDGKVAVPEACRYTYWRRFPTRQGHLLQPTRLDPPNPKCYVCSTTTVDLWVDTTATTFEVFLAKVLKGRLGFNEPTVSYGEGAVWEEGDDADDFSVNLPKLLVDLPNGGLGDGALLSVEDFSQDLEVQLRIHHRAAADFDAEAHPEGFAVGDMPKPKEPAAEAATAEAPAPAGGAAPEGADASTAAACEDDDDVCVVVDGDASGTSGSSGGTSEKRVLESGAAVEVEGEGAEPPKSKRARK